MTNPIYHEYIPMSQEEAHLNDDEHMENGILSQVAAEDDDGDQPYEAGQMDGLSQQSQQSLNMSQLEHYADGMKPDEADSPVPDSAAIDEEVISITHKQESVPEPVPPVPEPVPEPSQTRVSTRRSAAASAASTTNDTVTPIKVDHSCTSSDAAAAIARQTPLHEKAMCLDSINAMLSAAQEADEVEIIDNAARQNAGILYCDETITEKNYPQRVHQPLQRPAPPLRRVELQRTRPDVRAVWRTNLRRPRGHHAPHHKGQELQ